MKHFIFLIIVGVLVWFGFYTGKQKTVVLPNDRTQHEQVSGLLIQNNVSGMDKKVEVEVFAKHDATSQNFVAPPPLSSSNIEPESPTTPPLPEASEKQTLEDIREQEGLRDELIASLKNNGAHEGDIQALSDSIDATLEDSLVENSPVSFSDSSEPLSEEQLRDELLASLRVSGVPEEQIHAMAESMSASDEASAEQQGLIQDAPPQLQSGN